MHESIVGYCKVKPVLFNLSLRYFELVSTLLRTIFPAQSCSTTLRAAAMNTWCEAAAAA